jgi:aryl-alcohol dehydrogenase-like predicted oxidoreductase
VKPRGRSLHASLRALKTDYIDIYCVLEPELDSHVSGDLVEELDRIKAKGDIRRIGVSGAHIDSVVTTFGASLDVVQCAETGWTESRFVPDITHSLFPARRRGPQHTNTAPCVKQLLQKTLARR